MTIISPSRRLYGRARKDLQIREVSEAKQPSLNFDVASAGVHLKGCAVAASFQAVGSRNWIATLVDG
jgi:hypothetical protein